ncbi:hypothetical protein PGK51_12155, partial [Riemerella anatipestifer]
MLIIYFLVTVFYLISFGLKTAGVSFKFSRLWLPNRTPADFFFTRAVLLPSARAFRSLALPAFFSGQ